jgi:hypothetical protein
MSQHHDIISNKDQSSASATAATPEITQDIKILGEQIVRLTTDLSIIEGRRVTIEKLKEEQATLTTQLHERTLEVSTLVAAVKELHSNKQKLEQTIADHVSSSNELQTHHVSQVQNLNSQLLKHGNEAQSANMKVSLLEVQVGKLKEQLKVSEQQVQFIKDESARMIQEVLYPSFALFFTNGLQKMNEFGSEKELQQEAVQQQLLDKQRELQALVDHANQTSKHSHTAFANLKDTFKQSEDALQLQIKSLKQCHANEISEMTKTHTTQLESQLSQLEIQHTKKLESRLQEELIKYAEGIKALTGKLENAEAAAITTETKAKTAIKEAFARFQPRQVSKVPFKSKSLTDIMQESSQDNIDNGSMQKALEDMTEMVSTRNHTNNAHIKGNDIPVSQKNHEHNDSQHDDPVSSPPSVGQSRIPDHLRDRRMYDLPLTRLLTPNGVDENRPELLMTADSQVFTMSSAPYGHKDHFPTMAKVENFTVPESSVAQLRSLSFSNANANCSSIPPSTRGSIGGESLSAPEQYRYTEIGNSGRLRRELEIQKTQDTQATFPDDATILLSDAYDYIFNDGVQISSPSLQPFAEFRQLIDDVFPMSSDAVATQKRATSTIQTQQDHRHLVSSEDIFVKEPTKRKVVTRAHNKGRTAVAQEDDFQASYDAETTVEQPTKKQRSLKRLGVDSRRGHHRTVIRSPAPKSSTRSPSRNTRSKSGGNSKAILSARFAAELA